MFNQGLDFHGLAPNSFIHISAFIVVCEAFLRIPPHFGLWLKVFNVKPKVVDGQHAECGGAMVSKLPNATWAAIPEFKSGPPMRLTSWINKGLDWAASYKVMTL